LSLPKSVKTGWWLIRITVPVTFFVFLLDYTGILGQVAAFLNPFFSILGLPGESAFILITSVFANIYSVIAVISTLGLSIREASILAVMCMIAHGFIIETAVLKKTGSGVVRMLSLRIVASLVTGVLLNLIMPEMIGQVKSISLTTDSSFMARLLSWAINISRLCFKIIILVSSLLFVQRLMEEFGIIRGMTRIFSPVMRLFGLPQSTTFSWLVANFVGLAYGSATMIDEVNEKKVSPVEADLLNHHVALSHSIIEDPLLFMAIGLPLHWMIWPRILIAIAVVWMRRLELYLRKKYTFPIPAFSQLWIRPKDLRKKGG
jgi:spore maturation protein SpmB